MFSKISPGAWARKITTVVSAAAVLCLGASVGMEASLVEAARPAISPASCGSSGVELIGFSDQLNKTSFGGFSVAELSGLTFDDHRDVYYAVADRAGAVPSHVFTLELPLGTAGVGTPSVEVATVLNNAAGTPFNGFTFDGEGIAMIGRGQMAIASESGSAAEEQPEIRLFSLDGQHKDELPVPAQFHIGPNNLSFESLSVSPNGRGLFTANEAPLTGDGRTTALRSHIRIVRFSDRGNDGFVPVRQYHYLTEPGRNVSDVGVAELVALSETKLLVLERGFVAGEGNTIRIFEVSLMHAEDVSGIENLETAGVPPVEKRLLVDLATCPDAGATIPAGATQVNALLDNFEAMTLGPKLPGGQRALVLLSDDNGSAVQTTRIVVLAVPASIVNPETTDPSP